MASALTVVGVALIFAAIAYGPSNFENSAAHVDTAGPGERVLHDLAETSVDAVHERHFHPELHARANRAALQQLRELGTIDGIEDLGVARMNAKTNFANALQRDYNVSYRDQEARVRFSFVSRDAKYVLALIEVKWLKPRRQANSS